MGWLNGSAHVKAGERFALDALLLEVIARLRDVLARQELEVAHLKAIGLSDLSFGVANLVSSRQQPELSLASHGHVSEADVIVNARVAADPAVLERHVRRVVGEVCASRGAEAQFLNMQSFRPGRPQPTHRYAVAK